MRILRPCVPARVCVCAHLAAIYDFANLNRNGCSKSEQESVRFPQLVGDQSTLETLPHESSNIPPISALSLRLPLQ